MSKNSFGPYTRKCRKGKSNSVTIYEVRNLGVELLD